MLTSVDFDNQARLPAGKIREVWAYGELPDKLEAIEPPIPEFAPELFLGIIFRLSKRSCPGCRLFFCTSQRCCSRCRI